MGVGGFLDHMVLRENGGGESEYKYIRKSKRR